MTIWKPAQTICVKVIGLVWKDNLLFATEVEHNAGRVKGVIPLGGTVEFGETREAALHREFHEELGTDISITGAWYVLRISIIMRGLRVMKLCLRLIPNFTILLFIKKRKSCF